MFSRKNAQSLVKSAISKAGKEQCKAWRRVQSQVKDLMVEYLQEEFDLIPVYYGVLADAVVEQVIMDKINSVTSDAPSVILPDKQWREDLLIDAKVLFSKWNQSGKAEEILDEWERKQEKIKHGI